MAGRRVTAGELDARLQTMDYLIRQLGAQVAAHELWHRDMLVNAGDTGANRRIAMWALVISAAAAVGALLTALGALIK